MKRKLSPNNRNIQTKNKKPKLCHDKEIIYFLISPKKYSINLHWRKILLNNFKSVLYILLVQAEHNMCNKIYCLKIGYTKRIESMFPRCNEHLRNFYKVIPLYFYPFKNENIEFEQNIHKQLKTMSLNYIVSKIEHKKMKECYSFDDLFYIKSFIDIKYYNIQEKHNNLK